MKIKSLYLSNYRSFKELPETKFADMTTIIGKNDVGKSTILLAADAFFKNKVAEQSDFFKENTSAPIVIRVELDGLSDELKSKVGDYLTDSQTLIIQKTFQLGMKPEEFFFKIDYVNDLYREIENKGLDDLKDLVVKTGATVEKTGKQPTLEDRRRAINIMLETMGEKKSRFPVKPSAEAKKFVESELPSFYLYAADSNLSTGQASFQNYLAPIVKLILEGEKATFDGIEKKIKDKLDENIKELTKIVQQHNDTVKDLHVTSRFQWDGGVRHDLEVIDVLDHPQLFQQRGFGLRRTIMLAVFRVLQNLVMQDEGPGGRQFRQILAIEEPEIYLHPGAQRQLFHSFESLAHNGIQIVLTTHSTVFVDRMLASNIILLKRNNSAETEPHFISDKGEFESIKDELGVRSSDIFFANCICLVEGSTEEESFPKFFKVFTGKSMDEFGIKIINLKGKTNSPEFLKAINEMNIPKVLIVDKDAETDAKRSALFKPSRMIGDGLISKEACFYFDEGEFEDSIDTGLLCLALQYVYKDHREITSAWLNDLKNECKKEGKKLTERLQRHLYTFENRFEDYDKVKVGRAVGDFCSKEHIPTKIKEYFLKTIELVK